MGKEDIETLLGFLDGRETQNCKVLVQNLNLVDLGGSKYKNSQYNGLIP